MKQPQRIRPTWMEDVLVDVYLGVKYTPGEKFFYQEHHSSCMVLNDQNV